MVNFHKSDSKKKTQTLRSLTHKLEQHPIWIKESKILSEKDVEGFISSWLKFLYFQFLPGAADDIYDKIFVSYHENVDLLESRQKKDKCFRCFSCLLLIPYKLLVVSVFLFPLFCFFMIFAGPLCK